MILDLTRILLLLLIIFFFCLSFCLIIGCFDKMRSLYIENIRFEELLDPQDHRILLSS